MGALDFIYCGVIPPIFIIYTIVKPADKSNRYMGVYCTLVSCIEWMAAATVLALLHLSLVFTSHL